MATEDGPRTLQTVERACQVLDALKELEGAGVTELANHLDMSKGGVYNYLATFHEQEYVVRTEEGYELSGHLYNVGEYVRHQEPLYTVGKSEINQLAEETGESAHLMIEQFGMGFYFYKAQGQRGISQEYHHNLLETPDYLHWSATGKSVLAALPDEQTRKILETRGMPAITENTITDSETLLDELETVKQQGYAQNDEEQIRGVRAVGAAVTDHDGDVLGAVSISGPTSRITDQKFHEEYPELIMRTKNVIEVNLETQGGQQTPPL